VVRGCNARANAGKAQPTLGICLLYSPLLRWAGSKRSAASSLAALWRPHFGSYIEPFCGSAALFFRLRPRSAILSDINKDLISFYETVSRYPVEVYDIFSKIPRERSVYYAKRSQYNQTRDEISKAGLFYYLNKNCFNGLYRTNRDGSFNVPFSDNRVGRYPSKSEFIRSCELISRAHFVCGDFSKVVEAKLQEGDFVYLDPPYASSKRLPFREYYPGSFSMTDIKRLEKLLVLIDSRGARFVLSYANTRAINRIARDWIRTSYRVRRNISGFSASRRMSTEQIITNIQGNI
jgi:DNA adenine methylase